MMERMAIAETIKEALRKAAGNLDIQVGEVHLEHPADLSHGDYSSNIAMTAAKAAGASPRELAEKLVAEFEKNKPEEIEKIEIAGPGFINFHLTREFFTQSITEALDAGDEWGKNDSLHGQSFGIEYYQPNYFKALHVGHLVNAIVGESLCRLTEFSGATVHRIGYYADIGPHIAKAVWALQDLGIDPKTPGDLSRAYEHGVLKYKEDESAKEEIDAINKEIYEGSNEAVSALYKQGSEVSHEQAEGLRERLGFTFDHLFLESETGLVGQKIVEEHKEDIFEESDGALIFKGEEYGLHTRVFLTSKGLPVYETKDLGLAKLKHEMYPNDSLVYVVDHEQSEYLKVVLKVAELLYPELRDKTKHVAHGRLGLTTGRMSSREGNVIMADTMLDELQDAVTERIDDDEIADQIGKAAMQYFILKQSLGTNITFDKERALSFEGDSGPYLQYSHTRAQSVLAKAGSTELTLESAPEVTLELERLLYRFPEVVLRASEEYEPHHVVHYLTELAGTFNSFYANTKIIGSEHEAYYLALTKAFQLTMKNGLWLLGIKTPERM